jgi:hypothetical protein
MNPRQKRSALSKISARSPSELVLQLALVLWELAKQHHVQERLRAEIMETLGRIRARGDSDFAVDDFDSMPYLLAVEKVCPGPAHLLTGAHPPLCIGSLEGPFYRDRHHTRTHQR